LPERPAVQPGPHSSARPDAIADVGEVFHRNGTRRYCGLVTQLST
jgi:hypothetical protein